MTDERKPLFEKWERSAYDHERKEQSGTKWIWYNPDGRYFHGYEFTNRDHAEKKIAEPGSEGKAVEMRWTLTPTCDCCKMPHVTLGGPTGEEITRHD